MFVVKVPCVNGLEKTGGCAAAGNLVLEAMKEIYSNEQGRLVDVNLLDLEEIHVDNSNLQTAVELIYKNSSEIFEGKPKTIFLGGDHSITYSIGKAFFEHCNKMGKKSCLIVFDAHADCMRSVDSKFPTHKEWLRALVEVGFSPEDIFLVGTRNLGPSEIEFLKRAHIKMIGMNQLIADIDDSCDILMEFSRGKELYVSIDIDVIDPAFAPGTEYKEPGGLTSRQFLYMIQRLNRVKDLKALDIVEINPDEDVGNLTVKLGAKILSEII